MDLPEIKRSKTYHLSGRRNKNVPPIRKIFPTSEFTLQRQPSGQDVDFDLYNEEDLPFLNKKTEIGRMVSKNIVQSSLDDDVMTDEEMIECANRVLKKEVDRAIRQFTNGLDRKYIENLNL